MLEVRSADRDVILYRPRFVARHSECDYQTQKTCQAEEKEERVLEREALSVTGRFCVITSRVSPSPPSAVLLAEVV